MKALIVDESGRTSARLQPALAQEGYVVQAAFQRGEALWLASEAEPDVIVICSARPGTHDVPVVTALRGDGERAPILVMARRGESADLVDVLDAGADDVVTSPVPFAEVAARLRALTRRAPHLVEDELRVGTLRLDRAARVAVRTLDDATTGDAGIDHASIGDALAEPGGATTRDVVSGAQGGEVAIDLTAREYAVLELLMRNAGHVVSRARIVDDVWGGLDAATSNLVDQVVSHLRRKLDRPFGRHDITTVRGVGYRIVDSAAQLDGVVRRAS
ncbi:response regulator transcription factor [Dermacoccus nishinomiyaensis]|uniref:response regulator transcription factor n=1 Tax=Dermacoccus nishinomiyaensis TaxID=1274 RepID=UPI00289EFD9D|nr:response regulator transcription factor [Dermacoccus nishinomiyaensis]